MVFERNQRYALEPCKQEDSLPVQSHPRASRCTSTGMSQAVQTFLAVAKRTFYLFWNYLRGMSVAGVTSTVGDFLSEAGFF